MRIDSDKPALLTGANGYVASWIAKELLDAGLTVHAAVRDPSDASKVGHLKKLAEGSPGRIRFFAADLLKPGSYRQAIQGCDLVFHTASPFKVNVRSPQSDLIDPALIGTRNVLHSAMESGGVRRIVMTSSCAAIYTDAADCRDAPGGFLTEAHWNTTASLDYQPYSYSKTLAEREAWKIAGQQRHYDLVSINPSLVIGPALNSNPTSESFAIVRQMGDGTMRFGAPRLGIGAVDVRDVAKAHVAAAYRPDAAGRYIISAHNTTILDMGRSLIEAFGARYPVPRHPAPKWAVWLLGPILSGVSRRFVANNVDIAWRADNTRGMTELGLSYRPLQESMEEMFAQMIETGAFGRSA